MGTIARAFLTYLSVTCCAGTVVLAAEQRVDQTAAGFYVAEHRIVATPPQGTLLLWLENPELGGPKSGFRIMSRRRTAGVLAPVVPVSASAALDSFSHLRAAARGQDVYVTWTHLFERDPVILYQLRFTRSADGGRTWEPDRDIVPAELARYGAVHSLLLGPPGTVYVVLSATVGGETRMMLLRSSDHGATWDPPIRVDRSPGTTTFPAAAADELGNVVVGWRDFRFGSFAQEFRLNRSGDRGTTWLPEDVRITLDEPTHINVSHDEAGRFFLTWETAPSLIIGWLASSLDGGRTWSAPQRVDQSPDGIEFPTLEQDAGGSAHALTAVAYEEPGDRRSLWLRPSFDGGTTLAPRVRLDVPDPLVTSIPSSVASLPAGRSYVAWAEYRNAARTGRILLAGSDDFGATFPFKTEISGTAAVSRYFPDVAIDPDGVTGVVAWRQRLLATDRYDRLFAGSAAGPAPRPSPGRVSNLLAQRGPGDAVDITYAPASCASGHAVYWGAATATPAEVRWQDGVCGLDASGAGRFDPGPVTPGSFVYFVVVGEDATHEGSFGVDRAGRERPEAWNVAGCDRPQRLVTTCE